MANDSNPPASRPDSNRAEAPTGGVDDVAGPPFFIGVLASEIEEEPDHGPFRVWWKKKPGDRWTHHSTHPDYHLAHAEMARLWQQPHKNFVAMQDGGGVAVKVYSKGRYSWQGVTEQLRAQGA